MLSGSGIDFTAKPFSALIGCLLSDFRRPARLSDEITLTFSCSSARCRLASPDDAAKQITKVSKGSLNVEAEIKAFYTRLTASDTDVQKQVQALTAESQNDNGGIYHVYEPHVVEWFPTESNWGCRHRTSDMTGHFLVVQNVGYGRGKHAGYNTALVAEFEAVEATTSTQIDPKHENRVPKVLSTKLVLSVPRFSERQSVTSIETVTSTLKCNHS